jgi:hypothetical protein
MTECLNWKNIVSFLRKEHSFTITEFVIFPTSGQTPQSSQTPWSGEWIRIFSPPGDSFVPPEGLLGTRWYSLNVDQYIIS